MENFHFHDLPLSSFEHIRSALDAGLPVNSADVRTLLDSCTISMARELHTRLIIAGRICKDRPELRIARSELDTSMDAMEEAQGEISNAQRELKATMDEISFSTIIKDKKLQMKHKAVEEWIKIRNKCSLELETVYTKHLRLLSELYSKEVSEPLHTKTMNQKYEPTTGPIRDHASNEKLPQSKHENKNPYSRGNHNPPTLRRASWYEDVQFDVLN